RTIHTVKTPNSYIKRYAYVCIGSIILNLTLKTELMFQNGLKSLNRNIYRSLFGLQWHCLTINFRSKNGNKPSTTVSDKPIQQSSKTDNCKSFQRNLWYKK